MVAEARFADEDLRLFDRLSDGYLHDAAGRSLRAAVGRLNPARTKEPGHRRALFASPTESGCDRFLDRLAQLLHSSEEHTSELPSLMRISYAAFFLKKKHKTKSS